jgi:hypothetical protein
MLPEEDELLIELEEEEVVEAPKSSNIKKGMILGGALVAALILINILNYVFASEQEEQTADETVIEQIKEEETDTESSS